MLGSTGQLEFVAVESITDSATVAALAAGEERVKLVKGTYTPFMTGEVVKQATVSQNPTTGEIVVNVTMDAAGTKTWGEFTTANIGKQVAIVLDGIVQSAPAVRSAITDGRTEISGSFTAESAKQLKTVLETGALPVTLIFSESRVVGPTLGAGVACRRASWRSSIGMALVALYVLVFYRGLGIIAVAAHCSSSASLYLGILAALSQLGFFSLTLPGIAGIVLTIGMAADSSVLILERFKEEVRLGKTMRSAANSGSRHGMMTSIDADLVTLVSGGGALLRGYRPGQGLRVHAHDRHRLRHRDDGHVQAAAHSCCSPSRSIPKAPRFWGVSKAEEYAKNPPVAAKGGGARC